MRRFIPEVAARLLSLLVLFLVAPAIADDQPAVADAPQEKAAVSVEKASTPVAPRAAPAAATEAAKKKKQEAAAKKRAVLARPAPRSLREARRRLAGIRVDVDFKDLEIQEAVAFIGRIAGFNVIVAPELQRDNGLKGLPPITFKLRQASLATVADLIARFTGTELALADGILSFTTPEAARGKPVLHIYSIAELTVVLHNFPGPDMNLRPSGAEFEQEEISEVENPYADPEKVVDMIKEFVAADTWEDEAVSISADSQKLIVRQYPGVHRKIARFLAMLRAAR